MPNLVNVAFYHLVLGTGEPLVVAELSIEPGWHVYWENPGQSGLPTEITGACVTKTVYPAPHLFSMPGDIVNYGYEDSVLLFATGRCKVGDEVSASWLACRDDSCVPGSVSGSVAPLPDNYRRRAIAEWYQNTQTTPVEFSSNGWFISIKVGVRTEVEYFTTTSLESRILETTSKIGRWRQEWKLEGENKFGNNDKVVVRIKKRGKEKIVIYTARE